MLTIVMDLLLIIPRPLPPHDTYGNLT
jgi:hypothetical protein